MSLTTGSIQVNLLKMVNPELQIELRSILAKSIKTFTSAKSGIKKFVLFGKEYFVRITIKPLVDLEVSHPLFMVVFENLELEPFLIQPTLGEQKTLDHARISELESELIQTKDHLQVYIEEIETSNEELQSLNEEMQSTNEELQSSNEELETSNEELQSTNEEMQIAYAELKNIHEELARRDQKLQELQAETRALLDNNLQGFLLIDSNYQIKSFNKEAIRLFEKLSNKTLYQGISIIDLFTPSNLESFSRDLKSAFAPESEGFKVEKRIEYADTYIWLLISYNPVLDSSGRQNSITVGILDITQQKKYEATIAATTNRLENLLNTQTHYVLRTDMEGRHTYWNQVFEDDYGWAYEGKSILGSSGLDSICEHDHEKAYQTVQLCINNPGKAYKVELDKPAKNGGVRSTLWEFLCILDDEGHPFEIQCMGIEVTDINKMRENERLLNEAQRLSKMGSWNFDFKKDQLTWSDALYDVFDADRATFKETHGSFLSLVDQVDREIVESTSKKAQETGEPFHIIYRITTPKGEKRFIEEYGFADKDDQGQIIRLYGTAQNVTERMVTEEKLRDSDRIFNFALDLLCITTVDGYFKVLNPAWSKLLGYTLEELKEKPYTHWVHPDDLTITQQKITALSEGKTILQFENRFKCSDGNYIWLSWNSYPFVEEGIFYAIARDIQEEKEIKQKLQTSEERFSQIADYNQSVIWETNPEGIYTYVSSMSKKTYGYEPDELIHKKSFFDIFPASQNENLINESYIKIAKHLPFTNFVNEIVKKDGSRATIQTNGIPFFDKKGTFLGYRGSDIDITEKIENEKALKESHTMLRKLADQVPGVVYQFKLYPDGRSCFPYASSGIYDIYEVYPEDVKEDAGLVFERLHPEDRERVTQEIFESAERMSLFHCEFRVQFEDGRVEWRLSDARPELLDDGSVLWYGIITNITNRKEDERRIQESELKLKRIIDNSSDIIVLVGSDGRQFFVSQIAESITGFTSEELQGKSIPDIIHPEDIPYVTAIFQQILMDPSQSFRAQYRHIHKTEGWIWLEGSAQNFLNDPGFKAILLTVRDISENKAKEEELRKLSTAVLQSSASIVITDKYGNIEYINPAFTQITGYLPEEVIGKNPRILKSGFQSETFYQTMWETISSGESWSGQLYNRKKSGEYYWESAIISPILDQFNKVSHYIAIKEDISEQKANEERLRQSEEKHKIVAENTFNWEFWNDPEGKPLYISPSVEKITGYQADELMNEPSLIIDMVHPKDRDRIAAHLNSNYERQYESEEFYSFRITTKHGQQKYIDHICRPVFNENGTYLGIRGSNIDVTERYFFEKKLIESENRFRRLFETLPNISVQGYDEERNIIYWNHASEIVYGYTEAEALGKKLEDLIIPESMKQEVIENVNNWIQKGEQIASQELLLRHKDGSPIPVFSNHVLLENNEGKKELYCIDLDLSNLKNTEDKLKLSEERYRSIIKVSNTGAWEYDLKTNRVWVSPEYYEMLGYDESSFVSDDDSLLSIWSDLLHPEDKTRAQDIFQQYYSGSMDTYYENYFRLMHKDGSSVWIWSRGRNLKNPDGSPTNLILGTHIDITALKATEFELQKSNQLLKVLKKALDNIPVAVYMKDKERRFTYGNAAILYGLHVEEEKFLGSKSDDYFSGVILHNINESETLVLNGETYQKESEVIDKDNKLKHYLEIKSPIYDENDKSQIVGILGLATDITDLKLAKEQIKESELYYKSVLKALPDMMFILSKEYIFLDFKASPKELYVEPAEFLQKNIKDVMPDHISIQFTKAIDAALAEKQLIEIEYELNIDGRSHSYNARIVAFGNDKVIILVRNITESKANLDRIKNLLSLEEEQNKRLVNFTHIVSHNLRSHTSNMQSIFFLMEMEEEALLENLYVSMLKESADNLNQTLTHLNEVLDINKNLESKYKKTSLKASIKLALQAVKQTALEKQVSIINKVEEEDDIFIDVVPAYLESIILNLITNAIKFKDDSKKPYVKIYTRMLKKCIMIGVEDNGLGIDLKLHGHKIFGMYKTFHDNKDSKGLGLFISKNQAEAMRGTIKVSSKPGVGSAFRLYLPYDSVK